MLDLDALEAAARALHESSGFDRDAWHGAPQGLLKINAGAAITAYKTADPDELTVEEARAVLRALDLGLTGSYNRLASAADLAFNSARTKLRRRLG